MRCTASANNSQGSAVVGGCRMALDMEGAMVFVTSIISSQEWIRLSEAAQVAFPNEVLARERLCAGSL